MCVCSVLPWCWGCKGCAMMRQQDSDSLCCRTATAPAELRRKTRASYSDPGDKCGYGRNKCQKKKKRKGNIVFNSFCPYKRFFSSFIWILMRSKTQENLVSIRKCKCKWNVFVIKWWSFYFLLQYYRVQLWGQVMQQDSDCIHVVLGCYLKIKQ